jgi:hypothetical protein
VSGRSFPGCPPLLAPGAGITLVKADIFRLSKVLDPDRYGLLCLRLLQLILFHTHTCVGVSICYHPCSHSILDFIMWDSLHGLGIQPWDMRVWTAEEWNILSNQLNVAQTKTNYPLIIPCSTRTLSDILKWMASAGFENAHVFYWYKTNQNVEGLNRFTYSIEPIVIGYKGGRHTCQMNFSKFPNPVHRHNILPTKTVRNHFHFQGERLNHSQKPLELVCSVFFCCFMMCVSLN